jgi:hypothetical protein
MASFNLQVTGCLHNPGTDSSYLLTNDRFDIAESAIRVTIV